MRRRVRWLQVRLTTEEHVGLQAVARARHQRLSRAVRSLLATAVLAEPGGVAMGKKLDWAKNHVNARIRAESRPPEAPVRSVQEWAAQMGWRMQRSRDGGRWRIVDDYTGRVLAVHPSAMGAYTIACKVFGRFQRRRRPKMPSVADLARASGWTLTQEAGTGWRVALGALVLATGPSAESAYYRAVMAVSKQQPPPEQTKGR